MVYVQGHPLVHNTGELSVVSLPRPQRPQRPGPPPPGVPRPGPRAGPGGGPPAGPGEDLERVAEEILQLVLEKDQELHEPTRIIIHITMVNITRYIFDWLLYQRKRVHCNHFIRDNI